MCFCFPSNTDYRCGICNNSDLEFENRTQPLRSDRMEHSQWLRTVLLQKIRTVSNSAVRSPAFKKKHSPFCLHDYKSKFLFLQRSRYHAPIANISNAPARIWDTASSVPGISSWSVRMPSMIHLPSP